MPLCDVELFSRRRFLAMASSISLYADAIPVPQLVEEGVRKVPEAYVQLAPVSYSLGGGDDEAQVPVVDMSAELDEIVPRIRKACEEWGFFQVVNHGVPEDVVEGMLQASDGFFNLPWEDKMEYFQATPVAKTTRYSFRFNNWSVVDWRDFLFVGSCTPVTEETINLWPNKPPTYRDAIAKFGVPMNRLAHKLLEFISLGLGFHQDRLLQALGGTLEQSQLTNRYLPCPQPELVLALRSHSDPNAITLLVQNKVTGLQVFKDGSFVTVHGLPNSIIVNIGDQIEVMTNGKYKSIEHRALANSDCTRYSIASFFESPREGPIVGPLPELVDEDNPPLYEALNYKDYLAIFFAKGANRKSTISQVVTCK